VPFFKDLLGALTGRREPAEPPPLELPPVPTSADLLARIGEIEADVSQQVAQGRVPELVASRVRRVCATARDVVPALDRLGAGNRDAHSVMATVTSYLPEALGGYLRLPRAYADRRPVDGGKTSLMVLVDQLDLLAATMDKILDAVYRADADALVAHGRFLAEKFGHSSLDQLGTPGGGPAAGGVAP
jgi:hypothetical protein